MTVLPVDGVPRVMCIQLLGSQHVGQGTMFEHHRFPEYAVNRNQVIHKKSL